MTLMFQGQVKRGQGRGGEGRAGGRGGREGREGRRDACYTYSNRYVHSLTQSTSRRT